MCIRDSMAMYVQKVESVFDIIWNTNGITYGDVYKTTERDYSAYNFDFANVEMLETHFQDFEKECKLLAQKQLTLPAYDQCIKASHVFNLLDARGVISVAQRADYIARVRILAKSCGQSWLQQYK